MNLKNLTDEEICKMLKDLKDLQSERQKEKEEPYHHYVFTGTWEWDVWAQNKKEAVEYFKKIYPREVDILIDEYKVEQYD